MCNSRQRTLCGSTSCEHCYPRSIASVIDDKYWISEKNKDINPCTTFWATQQFYWFRCKLCNHEYETKAHVFVTSQGCSYCSRSNKASVCKDVQCKQCFDNSLASVITDSQWDLNANGISTRSVRKTSTKRYWFYCKKCNHKIQQYGYSYISSTQCIHCQPFRPMLCDDQSCIQCMKRSFASHPMSIYWIREKNGDDTPRSILRHCNIKYKFLCPHCHTIYCSSPNKISQGVWCSCTKNKTESKVLSWLRNTYPEYNIVPQFKLDKYPNRRYDTCISNTMTIIEIDGRQHFEQVSTWEDPQSRTRDDCIKMYRALKAGYSILRLLQEDIWYDRIHWQSILRDNIINRSKAEIVYCSIAQYENHRLIMKSISVLNAFAKGTHSNDPRIKALTYYMDNLHISDSDRITYNLDDNFHALALSIGKTYQFDGPSPHILYQFFTNILVADIEYVEDRNIIQYEFKTKPMIYEITTLRS